MRPSKEGYTVIGEMTTILDQNPTSSNRCEESGFRRRSLRYINTWILFLFHSSTTTCRRTVAAELLILSTVAGNMDNEIED